MRPDLRAAGPALAAVAAPRGSGRRRLACLLVAGALLAACDLSYPTTAHMLHPRLARVGWPDSAQVGDTITLAVALQTADSALVFPRGGEPILGWRVEPADRLHLVSSDSIREARFEVRVPGAVRVSAHTLPSEVLDTASTSATVELTVAWTTVSTGVRHTCAVGSWELFCWGGMVMDDARAPFLPRTSSVPRLVPGQEVLLASSVTAAGGYHACGGLFEWRIPAAPALLCWGANDHGQLGNGSQQGTTSAVPVLDPEPQGVGALRITAGEYHTCGVWDAGTYCWGDNRRGQLGSGSPAGLSARAALVPLALRQVSAGGEHTCGVTGEEVAWCWGDNRRAQLGTGDESALRRVPARVSTDLLFTLVSAGATHTCGVTPSGFAYCWGDNRFGQLGARSVPDDCSGAPCARQPVLVTSALLFRTVSAGDGFTCGITTDEGVYCWGKGGDGQLGRSAPDVCGGEPCSPQPGRVVSAAVGVSAGTAHACAVLRGRDLVCWGRNDGGQLGDGTQTSRATPRRVMNPEP